MTIASKAWYGLLLVVALYLLAGQSRQGACFDLGQGPALFKSKCASCHGKDGKGNRSMLKILKAGGRTLRNYSPP